MDRNQIEEQMARLVHADALAEWDIALEFANALRNSGTKFEVTLTTLDAGKAVTTDDFRNNSDRVAVLNIGGFSFVWQPKQPASVDAFMLE